MQKATVSELSSIQFSGTAVALDTTVMKHILLCTSDPLLTRNLYGILRDEGFLVDTVEHPSSAVKKVLWTGYDFVIVDSEPFGLSAEDAVRIIHSVAPDLPILLLGNDYNEEYAKSVTTPLDLEEFKQTIHCFAV